MRALVAGGAGFLGSALCGRLLSERWEVVCVDNLSTSGHGLDLLEGVDGFSFVERDVTWAVPDDGQPLDVVFHLASPASPADYQARPRQTLQAGAEGTRLLLSLAEQKQARFILASTSEVYGSPTVHPQPESYWGNVNPVGPRSMYDEAKRFAEATTMAWADTVDVGIARIFNTYGPGMRPTDGRAVPTFIRQAIAGEPMTVHGEGSQTRSLCYVDDMTRGLLALAQSSLSGPVNLGNPDEITMYRLALEVRSYTDIRSEIILTERPPDDPDHRCPDISFARRSLGWGPRVTLRDGLRRTVEWMRYAA